MTPSTSKPSFSHLMCPIRASDFHTWQNPRHPVFGIFLNDPSTSQPALSAFAFGLIGSLAPAVLCIGKWRMKQACPLRTHTFASALGTRGGNQLVWRILLLSTLCPYLPLICTHSGCQGRRHSYHHVHLCGCCCCCCGLDFSLILGFSKDMGAGCQVHTFLVFFWWHCCNLGGGALNTTQLPKENIGILHSFLMSTFMFYINISRTTSS